MEAAAKTTKAIEASKLPTQLKHAIKHALQSWVASPSSGQDGQDGEEDIPEAQKSAQMIAHFNSMIAKYELQAGVAEPESAPVVEAGAAAGAAAAAAATTAAAAAAATGVEAERSSNADRSKGDTAITLVAAAVTITKAIEASKLPTQLKHALSQALQMSMGEARSGEGGEEDIPEAQKSAQMIAHFNSMIAKYELRAGVAEPA
jgi:hypothetical protein